VLVAPCASVLLIPAMQIGSNEKIAKANPSPAKYQSPLTRWAGLCRASGADIDRFLTHRLRGGLGWAAPPALISILCLPTAYAVG